MEINRICVLDEVTSLEDLLSDSLKLRHYQLATYQTPLASLEALRLSAQQGSPQKIDLLVIGSHPETSFLWRNVVLQARLLIPALPVVLISNIGHYEKQAIEHQLPPLKVIDEPFRLDDLYSAVDSFAS